MKIFLKIILVLAGYILAVSAPSVAQDKQVFSTAPVTKDGKKWQIAYYEGGPYVDYPKILEETIRGLMKLGWIETADLPTQKGEETKPLWDWLVQEARSDYLIFLPDGHYSANWDEDLRGLTVRKIMERLNHTMDVDLVIAMGTWAGKDLANDNHSTPTLVFSSSDPVAAGIIKSIEDSGFEHVNAAIDPYLYERQIRVFHELMHFKRLGVAYEDTDDGRSYAAIRKIEKVAKERGFEIVRCFTVSDIGDIPAEVESVKQCFHKFGKEADAIYVTQQSGIRPESIPDLVRIANQYRIPTFSQAGSEEVKYGFLISIAQAGYRYSGEFHAQTMTKVLNGAKPNQLTQCFEQPPQIAINMETAQTIGFDPPIVLLGAADEIFYKISPTQ